MNDVWNVNKFYYTTGDFNQSSEISGWSFRSDISYILTLKLLRNSDACTWYQKENTSTSAFSFIVTISHIYYLMFTSVFILHELVMFI